MWTETEGHEEQNAHLARLVTLLPVMPLPPKLSSLGPVDTEWLDLGDEQCLVLARGGTLADRILAHDLLRVQLAHHGYRHLAIDPTRDMSANMARTAHWDDIMEKAKRLKEAGNVSILRNSRNAVVAHVVGDHGEYNCEYSRDDPNSWAITGWQCECPWDQYAWQRTRQWKKYEGRVCSHVLAAYWQARQTPLDAPGAGEGPAGQAPPGQMPGQPETPAQGELFPGAQPGGQFTQPFGAPPGGPNGLMSPAPPDTGVIPPQPMLPGMGMEPPPPYIPGSSPVGWPAPPNAVSAPGARQPSPAGPVQFQFTFSKTAAGDFEPDMLVRLDKAHMGILEGKSEQHGAGQYQEIPQNEIGTVRGTDEVPVLGKLVEVVFAGPCRNNGPMEPYHVRAFIPASDLTVAGWARQPGPWGPKRVSSDSMDATPPTMDDLPDRGPYGGSEDAAGSHWYHGGGCAHLALAFKNLYPDMKLAAQWYDDRGRRALDHVAAYNPRTGKTYDVMGTQHVSYHPYGAGAMRDDDADPQALADHMGIRWSPDYPWENDDVHEAATDFIPRHFGVG